MNAADAFDIGSFDEEDTKGIKVQGLAWPPSPEHGWQCPPSSGPMRSPCQPHLLGGPRLLLPTRPRGWPLDQTTMFRALQLSWPVADSRPFSTLLVKLLDSDQELYRNFPLTISERWQQVQTVLLLCAFLLQHTILP